MDTEQNPRSNKLLSLLFFLGCMLLLSFFVAPERASMWANETLGMGEVRKGYTELYFEEPILLPKTTDGVTEKNLTFKLHNLEGKDMTYDILVFSKTKSLGDDLVMTRLITQKKNIDVPSGGYDYTVISDILARSSDPGIVFVQLSTGEQIRFLINVVSK